MLRLDVRAARIHLRQIRRPLRLLDGACHNAQDHQHASRRLNLRENQKREHQSHESCQKIHRTCLVRKQGDEHDQDAEEAQRRLLRDGVRREDPFDGEIRRTALIQGFAHACIALAAQVERLDDGHSLDLLENRLDQFRLRLLPLRRKAARLLFHRGGHEQVAKDAENKEHADAPLPEKQHGHEDQRIQKATQKGDQEARRRVLHIVQNRRRNTRKLASAAFVKIAHGNRLELVADGDALLCHHEVAGMDALQLRKIMGNCPARHAQCEQPQRRKRRLRRSPSFDQGLQDDVDRRDLQDVEECVNNAQSERLVEVSPLLSRKMPNHLQRFKHGNHHPLPRHARATSRDTLCSFQAAPRACRSPQPCPPL